jgi:hypothetical protein
LRTLATRMPSASSKSTRQGRELCFCFTSFTSFTSFTRTRVPNTDASAPGRTRPRASTTTSRCVGSVLLAFTWRYWYKGTDTDASAPKTYCYEALRHTAMRPEVILKGEAFEAEHRLRRTRGAHRVGRMLTYADVC